MWRRKGETQKQIDDLDRGFTLNPNDLDSSNMLSLGLRPAPTLTFATGPKRLKFRKHACEINAWSRFPLLDTFDARMREQGDFAHAVELQQRAINLAGESKPGGRLQAQLAVSTKTASRSRMSR